MSDNWVRLTCRRCHRRASRWSRPCPRSGGTRTGIGTRGRRSAPPRTRRRAGTDGPGRRPRASTLRGSGRLANGNITYVLFLIIEQCIILRIVYFAWNNNETHRILLALFSRWCVHVITNKHVNGIYSRTYNHFQLGQVKFKAIHVYITPY